MGFGVEETEYAPEIRRRNRIVISFFAVLSLGAVLLAPAFTTWPLKNALGIAVMVLLFYGCLWWMFASRRAGKLEAPTSWAQWRKQFPNQL